MAKRYIILQSIGQNRGNGVVSMTESTITVQLSGTEDEFELYFMGSGAEGVKINAGKIHGGLAKSFELAMDDVKKIDTVVLLKDTEPVIYGSLSPVIPELRNIKEVYPKKETEAPRGKWMPLGFDDGYTWLKIEDGRFAENYPIIRHIFENIYVIGKINMTGFYLYGTKGYRAAVAIPAEKGEENPFRHLSDCARYINGYWTVGADKRERYFFSLTD